MKKYYIINLNAGREAWFDSKPKAQEFAGDGRIKTKTAKTAEMVRVYDWECGLTAEALLAGALTA